MYYLLKDGRIFDDKKDYFRVDGKFINYGENCNGTFLDYEEKWIAKSENLLDLARVGDCVEVAHGRIYVIEQDLGNNDYYYINNTEHLEYVKDGAIALWKRRGNIMERHEVK